MRSVRLTWVLIAAAFVLVCWNGHNMREGNAKLDAKCAKHHGTLHPTWDGGTLVAVQCNDKRRFTR